MISHALIICSVVENVLEKLVGWAASAIETSSNQPLLPHAILALNAEDYNINESLWDIKAATTDMLKSLEKTVDQNETFKQAAQYWRERDRQIETVEQLMLCYYSSIQVRNPTTANCCKSNGSRSSESHDKGGRSSSTSRLGICTMPSGKPVWQLGSKGKSCACFSRSKSSSAISTKPSTISPAWWTNLSTSSAHHGCTARFHSILVEIFSNWS